MKQKDTINAIIISKKKKIKIIFNTRHTYCTVERLLTFPIFFFKLLYINKNV